MFFLALLILKANYKGCCWSDKARDSAAGKGPASLDHEVATTHFSTAYCTLSQNLICAPQFIDLRMLW